MLSEANVVYPKPSPLMTSGANAPASADGLVVACAGDGVVAAAEAAAGLARAGIDGAEVASGLAPFAALTAALALASWRSLHGALSRETRARAKADALAGELRDAGLTVEVDLREELRPGAKYFHWEQRGVPVRIELGPRDPQRRAIFGDAREVHEQAAGPGPAQGLEQQELAARLKHSINGLKEPYRSLVVLRDVQQHSYEEVASVLELSLSQVKVYLHRARKQLREQLAEVRP